MRTATLALLPLLSGCMLFPEFAALQARIDGLMNPLIAQGMVIGVEEPDDGIAADLVALTGLEPGTSAHIFLADAAHAETAGEAPVEGALVEIDGVRAVEANEGGMYALNPDSGLPYRAGDVWYIDVDRFSDRSELSSVAVTLPPVVDVAIPDVHEPLSSMTLDLHGQGFTAVMVLVVNQYGVTHDSQPQTLEELVVFTKGTDEIGTYVIPGEAFPEEGAYAVGVAGLDHNDPSTIVNLNTLASTVMAGKLRFYSVGIFSDIPAYP